MTAAGYFLLAARSVVAAVEQQCTSSGDTSEAACSTSNAAEGIMSSILHHHHEGNCEMKCALYAAGFVAGGLVIGYFIGTKLTQRKARCNHLVKLDSDKVVDTIDIEDVGEKKVLCRCWKSANFPYCDGSHNAHNKETGDNVGPLIVKGKPANST
jgi:CDGSH-type Zn-finger protein